jgi:hypothetical protein
MYWWPTKDANTLLTTDQKQRVAAALDFDPDEGDVVTLVERLETAAEFHQFVLHYNPNDGLLPLLTIVGSPACDQGTALYVYWLLADFVMDREAHRHKSDPKWDGVGLIEEIEHRYLSGFYTQQKIRFVPLGFLGWSLTKLKLVRQRCGGTLPFPATMAEPSPGNIVRQEDF